ncbi:DUF5995 family protein [Streptomyces rectiverticillatus]|uniref:DUF5995 family protein n=1 Tax=Streptomyces rectiverticillatus TaxID=173860 RepID=UPI0015C321E9|nr:DUF5995 family protein [Streptomyces rectiverticillatus]
MRKPVRAVAVAVAVGVLWTSGVAPAGAAGRLPAWCDGPVVGCAAVRERALAEVRDGLGCDHRAPFAALYVRVQEALGGTLRERPGLFAEPSWAGGDLNAAFVDAYLKSYEADRAGRPVPEAWRIAFTTARAGDSNAGQDALLGANAHIQRDMPYVLAGLGLVRADGTSRKGDFDRAQTVLDRAYVPAVADIARLYDPLLALADGRWNPLAQFTVRELLVLWRQNAWHHARRLAAARSAQERRTASRAVETNATTWGRLLAAVRVPGYGQVRDGYCHRERGGALSPSTVKGAWPLPTRSAPGRLRGSG